MMPNIEPGDREATIARFWADADWAGATEIARIGDASTRTYRRLEIGGVRRFLMDAPPNAEARPTGCG